MNQDYILTKKEFMKEPEGKACVRETRIVAIISYVLNIIFAILCDKQTEYMITFAGIYIVLTAMAHLLRQKGPALLMVLVGIAVGVGFSSRNVVSVMGCTILPVAVGLLFFKCLGDLDKKYDCYLRGAESKNG